MMSIVDARLALLVDCGKSFRVQYMLGVANYMDITSG